MLPKLTRIWRSHIKPLQALKPVSRTVPCHRVFPEFHCYHTQQCHNGTASLLEPSSKALYRISLNLWIWNYHPQRISVAHWPSLPTPSMFLLNLNLCNHQQVSLYWSLFINTNTKVRFCGASISRYHLWADSVDSWPLIIAFRWTSADLLITTDFSSVEISSLFTRQGEHATHHERNCTTHIGNNMGHKGG